MIVSTVYFVAMLLFSAQAVDTADVRLEALPVCPPQAVLPSSGCLGLDIHSAPRRDGNRQTGRFFEDQVGERTVGDIPFEQAWTVRLTGRLAGGPSSRFEVTFRDEAVACDTHGNIALLGFGETGNPIIATDLGPLELLDPDLLIVASNLRIVIDASSAEVSRRLFGSLYWELLYRFVSPTEIYVWDWSRGQCSTAPDGAPGLMRSAPGACGDTNDLPFGTPRHAEGDLGLVDAQPGDLDIVRQAMGEDWWAYNGEWAAGMIHRIEGHDAIVVDQTEICT